MRTTLTISALLIIASSCAPGASFKSSSNYTKTAPVKNLNLIVIGDDNTKTTYNYLEKDLKDSLSNYMTVQSKYHCCTKTPQETNTLLSSLSSNSKKNNYVLTVVSSDVVIGYGAPSSRELKLALLDDDKKTVWNGTVSTDFNWYVSNKHKKALTKKFTTEIVKELHSKGIIN